MFDGIQNQTTNLLAKCVHERDKMQVEMWNMQNEMERMKRMEGIIEGSLNLSERNFQVNSNGFEE